MIDSHVHTYYSKHAEGSVEDIVIAAIANNIKILTITDHAPYPVDSNNRLLESELILYLDEIKEISKKYEKKIDVLVGLEVDFHPDEIDYIKSILQISQCFVGTWKITEETADSSVMMTDFALHQFYSGFDVHKIILLVPY